MHNPYASTTHFFTHFLFLPIFQHINFLLDKIFARQMHKIYKTLCVRKLLNLLANN